MRRPLLWLVLALMLTLLAVKLYVADLYTIPQNGMYPGLPQGSRLLARKHPYRGVWQVKRGDVIIFTRMIRDEPYNFVSRVIALPGDRVDCRGSAVLINGQALPRQRVRVENRQVIERETSDGASYEVAYDAPPAPQTQGLSILVPPDQVFVLGDNRDESRDSRHDGPVPFSSITARKL